MNEKEFLKRLEKIKKQRGGRAPQIIPDKKKEKQRKRVKYKIK